MSTYEALTNTVHCSTCGRPITEDDLGGLCASCMFGLIVDGGEFQAAPAARVPGLLNIPGYEVREEIARGGMGIVYRARQLEPDREVALKMLLPHQLASPGMLDRFRLEARAIAALEHPAILPVHHVGEHNGLPFFTMKLASGGSLAERKERFADDWRGIAGLLAILAEAVQFAHERGVLHRDLKPGNVLFDEAGRPYVSDFGLAKLVDAHSELTRSADLLGTPHYVAPEVAAHSAKDATTASDIYSLGAILYELLAGRPPFEAEGVPALLKKIAEEEPMPPSRVERGLQPPPTPGIAVRETLKPAVPLAKRPEGRAPISRDLEVICLKCLVKEPTRRYASARELAEDLRRWLNGHPILARPATQFERVVAWARRNPVIAALTFLLLLMVGVGVGLETWAYHRVSRALHQSQQSEVRALENLHASLLSQARAQRASEALGRRFDTLETLRRAAALRRTPEMRDEAAAALALRDLRPESQWPIWSPSVRQRLAFTPDLQNYFTATPTGGFALCASGTTNVSRHYIGPKNLTATDFICNHDGRMVGASYNNGALEIWSVDGERSILHVAGSRSSFAQAAFQPKSTKLLLSSAIEGVFRFDTETGAREKILISGTNLLAMRFAPSGEQFAVVRPNMVEIWQAEPLKRLRQIPIGAASAWMAWSPDSRQLAVGSGQERIVLLLDANSGKPLMRLFGHRLSPVRWEFHPSGHWLGSIGWDRTLRVWDVRTGEQLLSIGASPRALAFSEDGGRIATAPKDDGVALFEWADTSVFREFAGNTVGKEGVYGLASSRDGRFLLSGSDLGVRIWDTRAAAEIGFIATPNPGFVSVFFSRQSDAVLYSTRNLGTIRRTFAWHEDSASGRAIPEFGPEEHIALPTNTVLLYVSADERHWLVETRGAGAELWRREDSGQMKLLLARGGRINPDFSRHGRWFSAGTYAGDDVDVFEISSGLKVATLAGHKANLVRFSPDSRWLITCDSSEYRCWQTSTWKPGSILPAELGGLKAGHLTFSPDGKLLAVQRGDDDVQLWELPQFRPLVHLRAPHALGLHALQLNAAGTRLWLLCEGHRVFEWNLTNLRHELAKLGLDWQDGR